MKKGIQLIILLFLINFTANSQLGWRNLYNFLEMPNSPRITALGGKQISLNDGDVNMPFYNPSLVSDSMKNKLPINYLNYYAGTNYGSIAYLFQNKKLGYFVSGLSYFSYGKFVNADASANILGNFHASEYSVYLSYAKPLFKNITAGINIKPVLSQLEVYYSFGIVTDLGLTYHNPDKLFTAAFVARNIGTQIISYSMDVYERVPFELQLGVTQKLKHAPFRLSLMLHNLQKFNYTYSIDEIDDNYFEDSFFSNTNEKSKLSEIADMSFRHVIAGVEFIPTKSFVLRFGYNYKRVKEMQIEDRMAGVGLSWGFGLLLKKYQINFSRAKYHVIGGVSHFSITANLANLRTP